MTGVVQRTPTIPTTLLPASLHSATTRWSPQPMSALPTPTTLRLLSIYTAPLSGASDICITFNGVHFGISIPLWEHKNRVKQSKAYALFTEIKLEQHRIDHKFEIRELYKRYETLKASRAEYKTVLDALSMEKLLQKSLELGQISFTEYALEMEYYYSAFDQYLQLEKELHLTVAELFKHQL